jgi:tricarballylate dehydrogenase
MPQNPAKLVVVGHGAAGLAAALSAAEEARSRGVAVDITVLEKAREDEAGGNTRWSPSNMRLDAPDRIDPGFADDMLKASGGNGDPGYFCTLADNATATVGWLQRHGVEFVTPLYYLSAGPARIQPVGGGAAIVAKLLAAAKQAGVKVRYEAEAQRLVMTEGHRVGGIEVHAGDGAATTLAADAVILASGGFQGNAAMMRAHFGPGGDSIKLISPGTRFDTGDGIRMATEQGAAISGAWDGMHIEPVDPRSKNSAPVVLVYPYGIVVDQHGHRFFDEGGGLMHETWEAFARDIHFARPKRMAYAILDSRLFDIEGFERAIRSDVPPVEADSIEALAAQIGIPASNLRSTVDTFNAAATGDPARFDAARCDGLATGGTLKPPKSNWARAITKPPYLAYPLVGAIAYTFGGLATSTRAEVLGERGPISGLYGAGETTGHFYGTAPNAVAVLRALVFGKIAGEAAVEFLQRR